MQATHILIIGYGNSLRGDDAAGPAVAELIEARHWPGVRALSEQQLFPELAEDIARSRHTYFVDASTAPGARVTVQPVTEATDHAMAHRCSPGALLRMARELYGARPAADLVAIPAEHFEPGTGLSASVVRHIEETVALLHDLVTAAQAEGGAR